jgi:8-oxo-dGTP diphosphatase
MRYPITKELPERFHIAVGVNVSLRKDDKYFLLRRANTGWADGYYTVPAGHLDEGEPLTAAAAREVKEEAGVDIDPKSLKLVHVMHRSDKEDDQERLNFYFLAQKWTGEPYVAEPAKADKLGWFALSELPEQTLENLRKTLRIYESQLLSELNW